MSADTRATRPTRAIPRWLVIFWVVAVLLLVVLRFVNVLGDRGTSNLLSIGLINTTLLVSLLWFVLGSGRSARLRFGILGAVVVAVLAGLSLFRFEGVSGGLIPDFEYRFANNAWDALEAPRGTSRGADLETTTPFDFPGFLGPDRNQVVRGVTLATDLEATPPVELWRKPIGKGLSGFAVVNGYAATMEQRGDVAAVTLYDVDTGELIWLYEISDGDPFEDVIAGSGPRSTPAIDDGVVYAQGVRGELVAIDGSSGTALWTRDLMKDMGVSMAVEKDQLPYGRPGSPLVVGDAVIVPVGGVEEERLVSVAAFDKKSGEPIWESGSRQISMASPSLGILGGVEQVLMVNENWVSGHDLATGELLWELPFVGSSSSNASVSQAVPVPPDQLFLSRGYGHGAALYRLAVDSNGEFSPELLWQSARSLRTKFTNVVIKDGYVYGLSEGVLECVELETGERAWKHGRYGHGQILLVGEVLVVLTEDGEIVYVEATPERRDNQLARFQAVDGQTWNTFAIAGDRVLVRNSKEIAVFRVPVKAS